MKVWETFGPKPKILILYYIIICHRVDLFVRNIQVQDSSDFPEREINEGKVTPVVVQNEKKAEQEVKTAGSHLL